MGCTFEKEFTLNKKFEKKNGLNFYAILYWHSTGMYRIIEETLVCIVQIACEKYYLYNHVTKNLSMHAVVRSYC